MNSAVPVIKSSQWEFNLSHLDWIQPLSRTALERGVFSHVYELNESDVLKLVSEKGALDYLKKCLARPMLHLPKVKCISASPVVEQATQTPYYVVMMEKLNPIDIKSNELWSLFEQIETQKGPSDSCSISELSKQRVLMLSREIRGSNPALSLTLSFLAKQIQVNNWFADLANPSNWMESAQGQLVLSDPVHHADNYVKYISHSTLH